MVFEQSLILATVITAVALVRLIRRFDLTQRSYVLVVGGVLTLQLLALVRADRFLGIAGIALAALTVLAPAVLETLARAAFGWGRVRFAVAVAGMRAILMPGAGLNRQQEILRGLALLERDGVDAALEHFRELAGETEDGGELAVIHEQIVSMFFYGLRWNEGIAHYEGQFHAGYAAVRPALALGLLRAYGESGRMDTAAGLLRALEEGPVGTDPRAIAMISQARVTFLAYAGEASVVSRALAEEHLGSLGMSPANGALLRGIAAARAGDTPTARVELARVPDLAGPSDARAVEASQVALEALGDGSLDMQPEIRAYAAAVATRLQRFLSGTPTLRRHGSLVTTPILITAQFLGYIAVAILGTGMGVLQLGALTPELWNAGSWARLGTAPFVHADAIGLLLAAYSLWLGGPVIERLRGSLQLAAVAIAAAVAGVLAAVFTSAPASVLAAGNILGFGVAFGALWLLLPQFSPGLAGPSRRTLAIPIALVLVANVLTAVPALLSLDASAPGLGAAGMAAVVVLLAVPARPREAVRWGLRVVAAAGVLLVVAGGAQVSREDVPGFFLEHRTRDLDLSGITFEVPTHVRRVSAGAMPAVRVPVYEGLIDELAARRGALVELMVVPGVEGETSALLTLDPELAREVRFVRADLPEAFAAEGNPSRNLVRRNGVDVAEVFERRIGDSAVLLLVAPPAARAGSDAVMAPIWASAGP